jgi:hypothetical protein
LRRINNKDSRATSEAVAGVSQEGITAAEEVTGVEEEGDRVAGVAVAEELESWRVRQCVSMLKLLPRNGENGRVSSRC